MNIKAIESAFSATSDGKCATAAGGMVSTAFPEATRAGVDMLAQGGNAIDAACAAALALSVCEPQASGVGGQTMAIIHVDGRSIAIDGSTRAPSLAHISQFNKGERFVGYRATTVPSTIAVLGHLNFRYGDLSWEQICQPAIRIAREGYKITPLQQRLQHRDRPKFERVPSKSGARYFLDVNGEALPVGTVFKQPALADLLDIIAKHGPRAFYRGKIAQRIDEDMRANDGFLRADDLALIPFPVERKVLKRRYRALTVATLPPPAAGRTLLLTLMMLNHLSPDFVRSATPESYHFVAETFRKAFMQRRERPFDPNTYPQQKRKTISRDFARELAMSIKEDVDIDLPLLDPVMESGDTTHLSVMDVHGNAVGITQSIELVYGSKAAAQGLGFLYNNYMNAFETAEPSHPYYLRPNAIPWTSVAPAIVFHQDNPWMVVGSPGSERIYSTVSQFLFRMVDGGESMCAAMHAPRLHCSIGGTLSLEAERFDPQVVEYLEAMGYKVKHLEPYAFYLGAIHAVMKCLTRNEFHGVAEVRRDGIAAGIQ